MQLVFGHVWALWWWRCTHYRATADALRVYKTLDVMPDAASDLKERGVLRVWQDHLGRGFPRDLSLSLLAKEGGAHVRMSHVSIRYWNGYVPTGAICAAGHEFVSSPEFTFVLIAGDIRRVCKEHLGRWQYVVVLAELGCELCGTYSKQNTSRGFKNRETPLVNTGQMHEYACYFAHERGSSLAYEALRWVIDGLNSPMETVLHLMLSLPRATGGRSIIIPRANYALPIPQSLWGKTKHRHIVPDLYWPEMKVVAEFFGEVHEGHEREDYERREIEQDMGLFVVTFWKDDLFDLAKFNAKADLLAQHLGLSIPAADEKFNAAQRKLQKLLVGHQSWV